MDKRLKPTRETKYGVATDKAKEGLGGVHVVQGTMIDPVSIPCVECPFRKDSKSGHLGGYTPELFIQAVYSPASIACHMSPGFKGAEVSKSHHCTGLAVFRHNLAYPHEPVMYGAVAAVAHVIANPHESHKNVFDTAEEFIAHHKEGQKNAD